MYVDPKGWQNHEPNEDKDQADKKEFLPSVFDPIGGMSGTTAVTYGQPYFDWLYHESLRKSAEHPSPGVLDLATERYREAGQYWEQSGFWGKTLAVVAIMIYGADDILTIVTLGTKKAAVEGVEVVGKEITEALLERGAVEAVGKTVIGKGPQYLKVAEELGAKSFDIPMTIWDKMSKAERWAANQKFLDRAIARGDEIILSTRVLDINSVVGTFRMELDYLLKKGYKLSEEGTRMTR